MFLWGYARTGVYGSILLVPILCLSIFPLGKSDCLEKGDECPNTGLSKDCCGGLKCYKGTCQTSKSETDECSTSWQNCCEGYYCSKGERCEKCLTLWERCSSYGAECCEGFVCNFKNWCVECKYKNESLYCDGWHMCKGLACPNGTAVPCRKIGHPCPNDDDDPTLKCCKDLACYEGRCLHCRHYNETCYQTEQNCCPIWWCDEGYCKKKCTPCPPDTCCYRTCSKGFTCSSKGVRDPSVEFDDHCPDLYSC